MIIGCIVILVGGILLMTSAHAANDKAINKLNESMHGQMDAFGQQFGADVDKTPDIRIVASRIIGVMLSIMGILILAYTMYGGYLYMTAAGNDERVTKARKIIFYGALGLGVMLMAYSITAFVYNIVQQGTTGNDSFEWNMWAEPDNSQYNNSDPISNDMVPDDYEVDWGALDFTK